MKPILEYLFSKKSDLDKIKTTKSHLHDYDIVLTRKFGYFMVFMTKKFTPYTYKKLGFIVNSEYIRSLSDYDNNLKCKIDPEFDIVKIFRIEKPVSIDPEEACNYDQLDLERLLTMYPIVELL